MIATVTLPILIIDLGNYKPVACWYDPTSGEACFESFSTSRLNRQRLLGGRDPAVVFENRALSIGSFGPSRKVRIVYIIRLLVPTVAADRSSSPNRTASRAMAGPPRFVRDYNEG